MTITGDFERFQYFNFETRVLKTEDFQKTEVSTKIENAIFSHNTALAEASVETNRMGTCSFTDNFLHCTKNEVSH